MRKMSSREIAVIGIMLALSLMLEIIPIEMPTMWGMKIDLVAVPVIMAYLLTGFVGGLTAVFLLFIGLSLISPTSWLGGFMKASATLAVLIGFEAARWITRFDFERANRRRVVLFAVLAYILGITVRIPLMVAFNYYFAIQMFLGIPHERVVQAVEEWTHVPFWVAIGLPNAVQSVIDVFISLAVTLPVLRRLPHLFE